MKRLIVPALALNTALLAVIAYELSALAQEGERVATVNGDTNGDGERDIADAVHILNWLFLGGPEPVALAETPETSSRLAALEKGLASPEKALGAQQALTPEQAEILGHMSTDLRNGGCQCV